MKHNGGRASFENRSLRGGFPARPVSLLVSTLAAAAVAARDIAGTLGVRPRRDGWKPVAAAPPCCAD